MLWALKLSLLDQMASYCSQNIFPRDLVMVCSSFLCITFGCKSLYKGLGSCFEVLQLCSYPQNGAEQKQFPHSCYLQSKHQVCSPQQLRQSSEGFILQPWPCVSQSSARLQDLWWPGALTGYGHKAKAVSDRALIPDTAGRVQAAGTHRELGEDADGARQVSSLASA